MHGLGNDFIVVENTNPEIIRQITTKAQWLADRRRGVGCDQILLITPSDNAHIRLVIFNQDGSEAEACGNGTRCVADLIMRQRGLDRLTIETIGGILEAWHEDSRIAVLMGAPRFDWREIPLSTNADTAHLAIDSAHVTDAFCVNLGNPHCVVIVDDPESIDIASIGPMIENHPIFPQKTNVEFIAPINDDTIRMRVWERGSGITAACGSGAIAAAIAAISRGLTPRRVTVRLDGGDLDISWREDNQIIMRGDVAKIYQGRITLSDDAA